MATEKRNTLIFILAILLVVGGIFNVLISFPWLGLYTNLKEGGQIKTGRVWVLQVMPNSPAEQAGLAPKDIILTANNTPIVSTQDFSHLALTFSGKPLSLNIERAGRALDITLIPRTKYPEGEGPAGLLITDSELVSEPPLKLIPETIINTYSGQVLIYPPGISGLTPMPFRDKSFSNLWALVFGIISITLGTGMLKLKKWSLYGYIILFIAGWLFDIRFAFGIEKSFSTIATYLLISLVISGLFKILISWYLLAHKRLFN